MLISCCHNYGTIWFDSELRHTSSAFQSVIGASCAFLCAHNLLKNRLYPRALINIMTIRYIFGNWKSIKTCLSMGRHHHHHYYYQMAKTKCKNSIQLAISCSTSNDKQKHASSFFYSCIVPLAAVCFRVHSIQPIILITCCPNNEDIQ